MLLTSHEYVVKVVNLSQCVLFIELNVWEDEWLVIIESLITKKKENKEGEENKMIQFMVNTPIFANWVKIEITKIFQKKPCK